MAEVQGQSLDRPTEVRHLLRAAKTSLELAIVARAPTDLVNRLGRVSGLLDAVSQLPFDVGPARDMTAHLIADALSVLAVWQAWEKQRTPAA